VLSRKKDNIMMYERPLHLKHSLERLAVAEQPTRHTTALRLPKVTVKLPNTGPLLPLDQLGRPYLVSFAKRNHIYGTLWDDTICQVSELIERYRQLSHGRYPKEIVLRVERYFVRRCERFYPFDDIAARPIPFRYEDASATYEILVRGEV
jgi:hypothetical protein